MTALATIRKRPSFYLGMQEVTGERLASILIEDIFCAGGNDVVCEKVGDIFCIASTFDWMEGIEINALPRLFSEFHSLKNGGPNSFRHEVLLGAFSEGIGVSKPSAGNVIVNAGDGIEDALSFLMTKYENLRCAVAYRVLVQANKQGQA